MANLSDKARQVYEYISQRDSSVPPSVRDICQDLNIASTSSVFKYLTQLEEEGLIEKGSNKNRSISLVKARSTPVPLLGTVTAGQPILAIEDIESYIPFPGNKYSASELFALHVRGESMIEAGILDGDIIIVHRTPTARNGEIVVALIDDEATVKTFYKENGHFRLQPENSTMDPIIVESVAILGKVVGLYRDM